MSDGRRHRFVLEVEDSEPISGRLSEEAGPGVDFSGWTGLAAVIDRALRQQSSQSPEADPEANVSADSRRTR